MAPPRIRLGIMMFLQYAIWGVWASSLVLYLKGLSAFQVDGGTDYGKIGLIFMTMPIASIIAPFLGGQIADRWFASQRFLAVSHVLAGIVLLFVARLTGFAEIFVGMLVFNLLYAPTIAVTNAIVFRHWPSERFSQIRAMGSVGWIVIGWVFGAWLPSVLKCPKCAETIPIPGFGDWVCGLLQGGHTPGMGDCLYFAAILSFILGVFALALPHTPPSKQSGRPWAFIDAFALMRNRAFAVMAVVAFFVSAEMQVYFIWTPAYLENGLGLPAKWIPGIMTFGQICELAMMVVLPFVLKRTSFRTTMALGIAAWAIRDFIFSIGDPKPLVVAAIALHGVGFAFFFTAIFMFADLVAPKDIKASAQSFLSSVTIGLGMLMGSLAAGLNVYFKGDWHKTYLVPAILCTVCFVTLLMFFRPKPQEGSTTSA